MSERHEEEEELLTFWMTVSSRDVKKGALCVGAL
jgi:hypothetical protein